MPDQEETKAKAASISFKLSPAETLELDRFIERMTVHTVLGVQRPSRVGLAKKALLRLMKEFAEAGPEALILKGPGQGEGAGEGAPAAETGDDADATAAADGEADAEPGDKPLL